MKTKKFGKKLVLNKETIVTFNQKGLGMIRGGQKLWTEDAACPPEVTETCLCTADTCACVTYVPLCETFNVETRCC